MTTRRQVLSVFPVALLGFMAPQAFAQHGYRNGPPPPHEEHVPAPRRGYVWDPGHWRWNGHRYVWTEGHWVHEKHGAHWVESRWEERDGRHYFVQGHWEHG